MTLSAGFVALCVLFTGIASRTKIFGEKVNSTTFPLPITVIHEFPRGTWIENIAVRKNGQILVTETTRPRVYQIDPLGMQRPLLVYEFKDTASVTGITEGKHDVFYVSTANLSSNFLESYGEAYIYEIDMRNFEPKKNLPAKVSKIATLREAKALNGLLYLGEGSDTLLNADTLNGVIWSIDIHTGKYFVAINDTLTQPMGTSVNGLKVRGTDLYFSNTIKTLIAKVPVDPKGRAKAPATVFAKGGFVPDDFTLDLNGDTYIASPLGESSSIVFVPREGGSGIPIAGIAGPTSAAFGRTLTDCRTLYVTTSGGVEAYIHGHGDTVAGKLVKLEVDREGTYGCE